MNKAIIIAGNIVTSFGNSMYVVALLIYITETRPHPFNVGSIQAAAYLPVALFGIYGGILADSRGRPGIIAGTDLIRSPSSSDRRSRNQLFQWSSPPYCFSTPCIFKCPDAGLFLPRFNQLYP